MVPCREWRSCFAFGLRIVAAVAMIEPVILGSFSFSSPASSRRVRSGKFSLTPTTGQGITNGGSENGFSATSMLFGVRRKLMLTDAPSGRVNLGDVNQSSGLRNVLMTELLSVIGLSGTRSF